MKNLVMGIDAASAWLRQRIDGHTKSDGQLADILDSARVFSQIAESLRLPAPHIIGYRGSNAHPFMSAEILASDTAFADSLAKTFENYAHSLLQLVQEEQLRNER